MSTFTQALPDVTRSDAGTTLLSEWHVETPERQQAAANSLLGEWDELSARFQPTGFVQLSCFGSTDGQVVLSYAQWSSDEAHISFAREHRPDMVNRIDQAVPGIQRPGLMRCRVHRNFVLDSASLASDLVILCQAVADTPGQAELWAETTGSALRAQPPLGISAAHLLLNTEATRALLYMPCAEEMTDSSPITLPEAEARGIRVDLPQRYRLIGSVLGPGSAAR